MKYGKRKKKASNNETLYTIGVKFDQEGSQEAGYQLYKACLQTMFAFIGNIVTKIRRKNRMKKIIGVTTIGRKPSAPKPIKKLQFIEKKPGIWILGLEKGEKR